MTALGILGTLTALAATGLLGYGITCDILSARERSRHAWANEMVGRLIRASGHCDGCRGYRNGARIVLHDIAGRVTLRVCADGGQVDPGEPGPPLAEAVRAIGDAARLSEDRIYDILVDGVHESASLRALERALSGHEILMLGGSLGSPSVHPAFRALAALRGVRS